MGANVSTFTCPSGLLASSSNGVIWGYNVYLVETKASSCNCSFNTSATFCTQQVKDEPVKDVCAPLAFAYSSNYRFFSSQQECQEACTNLVATIKESEGQGPTPISTFNSSAGGVVTCSEWQQ